jgi:hypothetical protein
MKDVLKVLWRIAFLLNGTKVDAGIWKSLDFTLKVIISDR